jgi:ATP-dependent Clp protease ATP-binding subunit ClpB
MDIEKFTERARGFIQSAQSLALREGNQQFVPEHLLKVLLDDEEGLAARLINAAAAATHARTATEAALKKLPKVQGGRARSICPGTARCWTMPNRWPRKPATSSSPPNICCWRWCWPPARKPRKSQGRRRHAQGLNARSRFAQGPHRDSATAENAYDALKKYARDLTEWRATASSIR